MPRKRTAKNSLLSLIEEAPLPVYLLDESECLVFANQALAQWVGQPLERLVEQNCHRQGTPGKTPMANALRGLGLPPASSRSETPPAEVMDDVVLSFRDHNQVLRRSARYTKIQNDPPYWLVLLSPHDLAAEAASPSNHRLHRLTHDLAILIHEQFTAMPPVPAIGHSNTGRHIRRLVSIAAQSQAQTVVYGPKGSDRERLAKFIFSKFSGTNPSELTPINCAIADQQLIQETFRRVSRRQDPTPNTSAHHWLLLIDIDLLEHRAQIELDGFLRLPRNKIRTLATCSTSLNQRRVATPVFEDLAARICELEIELPPLCERRSDLPLMIQHAVELTAARRGHTTAPRIAEATIEWLLEYDWPGNAHELLETIELAMDRVLPPTSANPSTTEIFEIKVEHFPERIRWAIKHGRLERPAAVEIDLESRLASIEKEFIERALHQAKANKTKAAQSLKISRGKFLRRCEQLGVQFPDVPIDFQFADDPIDFREDES